MPAIIKFLGYNPLPAESTLAEQLVRQRASLGLSQKDSAERLGVDPSTLAKWEQGKENRRVRSRGGWSASSRISKHLTPAVLGK